MHKRKMSFDEHEHKRKRSKHHHNQEPVQDVILAKIQEKKTTGKIWFRWAHSPTWHKVYMSESLSQVYSMSDVVVEIEKAAGMYKKATRQLEGEDDETKEDQTSKKVLRKRQKLGVVMLVLAVDARDHIVNKGLTLTSKNLLPFALVPGHEIVNEEKLIVFRSTLAPAIKFYEGATSLCSMEKGEIKILHGGTKQEEDSKMDETLDEEAKMMLVLQASEAMMAHKYRNPASDPSRLRHRLPESLQNLVTIHTRTVGDAMLEKFKGQTTRTKRVAKILDATCMPMNNFRPAKPGEENTRTLYRRDGRLFVLVNEKLDVSIRMD